ncbi:uncharacterized protein LOC107261193 [Ricinus communis]|uniref:uncharacterized protein LOC107261193 n=1 Tax=Ricinus communis TaxID=3988 RepID=UPI000772CD63|nr:uncharacterized protein LOC107261193 [Ricinus communis]|eukprot:XP_015574158.1 uncharacterized protein LOC107261193 [Ricinus communis]
MDVVSGLPKTSAGYDSIWVIMDQLTKSSHFLPVKTPYSMATYARVYLERIVSRHNIPEEVGEWKLAGPKLFQITLEKVPIICERLKIAFSRQKNYADPKWKHVEFSIGEYVFLKVSLMRGVIWFGKKHKLAPYYVGPSEIIDRIEEVAYKLDLSLNFSYVQLVFHISILRKYISNPSHVLQPQYMEVSEDLTYEE